MTDFAKVADSKYAVTVTLASGKVFRILVKKVSVGNPSARGGAYKDAWVAYNGALNLKVQAETRQGAYDEAIRNLQERGWVGAR